MDTIFSLKMPSSLLTQLETMAHQTARTRGALIREAVVFFMERHGSLEAQIDGITKAIRSGKKPHVTVDWKELRRCAASGECHESPEQEVLRGRHRGL